MSTGNSDNIFTCLHCGAAIHAAQEMHCDACGKKYLQLDGIPVLMQDTRAYLIEMIGLYASFISEKEEELSWDPLESTCRHASLSIL